MSDANVEVPHSFVEFEEELPLRLTEGSAESLKHRLATQHNFGGLAVHGVGWFIANNIPEGLDAEALETTAYDLAGQLGNRLVAGSIRRMYQERQAA